MGSLQYMMDNKTNPLLKSIASLEGHLKVLSDLSMLTVEMGKRMNKAEESNGEWDNALRSMLSEFSGLKAAFAAESASNRKLLTEALSRVEKLSNHGDVVNTVGSLRSAIAGIKMPEIPAAKEVSLDGLERAISRKIDAQLDLLKNVLATQEVIEPPKKTWTFLVDRDSQGYIKQIRAI